MDLLRLVCGRCPWSTDAVVAIKRILSAAVPASMGTAVSDTLK